MDIAWFTDTWLPNRDGVVTSLLSFMGEMEKRGHNIYIFAPGEGKEERTYYYKSFTFPPYPQYKFPTPLSLLSRRTSRIIKEIDADIIHSHSPGITGLHARIASIKTNTPMIFTFHTFIDDSVYLLFKNNFLQEKTKQFIYRWLRIYAAGCRCIVVPSPYVKRRLMKIIPEANFEIIPTGIDMERFEKGNGERIKERFPDKKIILHVGRVVKEKNIEVLIKAAPRIIKKLDAVFIIVGEGPHRKKLEKMVEKMQLSSHFIFTGFVNDDELLDYYKAADVFAFPSKYETQGLVAFEAMAAGVPVVASREKALPDFIKEGENGYLASADSDEEFAEKILMALEDKEIAERAKKFVRNYTVEKMAIKLEEVYVRYGNKM